MQQRRSADAQQTEISDGFASSDSVHTGPLSTTLPVEEIARGLAYMVAGEPFTSWVGHIYIYGRWLQDSPLKDSNMAPVHNLPPSRYYISSAAEGFLMMYDRPANQWYALKRAHSTLTQCYLDKLCDKLELYTGKPCLKVTPLFLEQALSYGVPYAVEYHLNRSLLTNTQA